MSIRTALAVAALVASTAAQAQSYEIWAVDQGTATVHIYNDKLEETAKLDMTPHGVRVPHMIDFTPDGAYALIAATASANVSVVRTKDRQVVATLATGPASHAATVRPDGRQAIVAVIGDPKVERDGKLVEINIDPQAGKFELGRSLVIADDPVFKEKADKFKDIGAVCQQYTADGKQRLCNAGAGDRQWRAGRARHRRLQARRRLSAGRAEGELRHGADARRQAHVRQRRRPRGRGLVRDRHGDPQGRAGRDRAAARTRTAPGPPPTARRCGWSTG